MIDTPKRPLSPAPVTVVEHVANAIRRGILDGRYPLGSRLDQQALADEYGASIIPVRESLRQLEAEGLVRIAPRRGAFVAQLSPTELAEIYAIRGVLEQLATKLAVAHATVSDVQKLEQLARKLDKSDETAEWLDLNRQWHFRLYALAQAPLLMQMIAVLWDRCSLYRHIYPRASRHRKVSAADHRRILQAAREGDGEAAGEAVLSHIRRAAEDVLSSIPSDGNAPSEMPATRQ